MLRTNIAKLIVRCAGPQFALHCVNHLLVPTIQAWLRQAQTRAVFSNANTLANFKQFVGLCSDLVAEFVVQFIGESLHYCTICDNMHITVVPSSFYRVVKVTGRHQ